MKPSDESIGVASLRDEVLQALLKFGLAKWRKMVCTEIGVHPWNRSESGVDPSDVHSKIAKCKVGGYSLLECSKATLLERSPGPKGALKKH